jgi:hypothetical protein
VENDAVHLQHRATIEMKSSRWRETDIPEFRRQKGPRNENDGMDRRNPMNLGFARHWEEADEIAGWRQTLWAENHFADLSLPLTSMDHSPADAGAHYCRGWARLCC